MVNPQQPKALYLAEVLSAGFECDMEWYEIEAAHELRRLYEENQLLRKGCEEQMRLHSQTLDELRVAEQELAAIDSQRPTTIDWEAVVNEIRALPTRSTGYPPYQHSPDWVKQQAADIVQRQMGEQA